MVPTKSNTFRYFLHDRVHPNVSGREWADAWISGRFYLKVVQAILIFGYDMCVVIHSIGGKFGGSTTRLIGVLQGNNLIDKLMESGISPRVRRKCRRQGWNNPKCKFLSGITKWPSI